MALPDLIEIVPPAQPAPVLVTIPGSKSITNRALILAALADGGTTLRGALWSEDTEIMVEALRALGFEVDGRAGRRRGGQLHASRSTGLGGRDTQRRHGDAAARDLRRQRGHGGALPDGDALPGRRRLPRARHAAHARAAAGRAVRRAARSWAIASRPRAGGCRPSMHGESGSTRRRLHASASRRARSSRRRCCCRRAAAAGTSRWSARTPRSRPTWR